MLKITCILIIVLNLFSCVNRTEYGRRRLLHIGGNKFGKDSIVYNFIDTAKIYEIVSVVSRSDNKPLESMNKTYLKFYENGRVGTFYSFDKNDLNSLNPRKAEIGYYKHNGENLEIKTFFEHVQGGGWMKENLIKSDHDTLFFVTDHILSKYIMRSLGKRFLIYKPDW